MFLCTSLSIVIQVKTFTAHAHLYWLKVICSIQDTVLQITF